MARKSPVLEGRENRQPPHNCDGQRLLALDLRNRMAGFVLLEPQMKLLDWGVRRLRQSRLERIGTALMRAKRLVRLQAPTVIVIRESKFSWQQIIRKIQSEFQERGIPVYVITADSVRTFFATHAVRDKHQTALFIAELFKDLTWSLPPKRKRWQHEHHNATIFDAAAVAIAFLKPEKYLRRLRGLSPDE